MKALGWIFTSISLLIGATTWASSLGAKGVPVIASNSVETSTETDGDGVAASTIGFNRADLKKPHILRVYGMLDNELVPMERVEVKMDGKVVKTIVNGSLEMDLAPLMTAGRYEVDVSGKSSKMDTSISLYFVGTHIKINQQSSGTGKVDRKLIINVR